MTMLEQETNYLEALRKRSYALEKLPDHIVIPALTKGDDSESRPLLLARVDDLAFAQQGLSRELSRIVSTLDALKSLHDMARNLGAKGADYALDYIRAHEEVQS